MRLTGRQAGPRKDEGRLKPSIRHDAEYADRRRQITLGGGIRHVHSGAWAPNGAEFVWAKDFDRGKLFVLDGSR